MPDTATAEDLRNFQLHLVDHGASPITLNATLTGLKLRVRSLGDARETNQSEDNADRIGMTQTLILTASLVCWRSLLWQS